MQRLVREQRRGGDRGRATERRVGETADGRAERGDEPGERADEDHAGPIDHARQRRETEDEARRVPKPIARDAPARSTSAAKTRVAIAYTIAVQTIQPISAAAVAYATAVDATPLSPSTDRARPLRACRSRRPPGRPGGSPPGRTQPHDTSRAVARAHRPLAARAVETRRSHSPFTLTHRPRAVLGASRLRPSDDHRVPTDTACVGRGNPTRRSRAPRALVKRPRSANLHTFARRCYVLLDARPCVQLRRVQSAAVSRSARGALRHQRARAARPDRRLAERAPSRAVVRRREPVPHAERGRARGLDELLALASGEQVCAFVDLDCWKKDRLAVATLLDWLEALIEAGGRAIGEFLNSIDRDLLILLLKRFVRVHRRDDPEEPEEDLEGQEIFELDEHYQIVFHAWDARAPLVRHLIEALYERDYSYFVTVAEQIGWNVDSELEEASFRLRNARLQDGASPTISRRSRSIGRSPRRTSRRARDRSATLVPRIPTRCRRIARSSCRRPASRSSRRC